MEYCNKCKVGFITKSERFRDPEGGSDIMLEWCSSVFCDYNVRKKL